MTKMREFGRVSNQNDDAQARDEAACISVERDSGQRRMTKRGKLGNVLAGIILISKLILMRAQFERANPATGTNEAEQTIQVQRSAAYDMKGGERWESRGRSTREIAKAAAPSAECERVQLWAAQRGQSDVVKGTNCQAEQFGCQNSISSQPAGSRTACCLSRRKPGCPSELRRSD